MRTVEDSIYLLHCPGFSIWILHGNNINSIIQRWLSPAAPLFDPRSCHVNVIIQVNDSGRGHVSEAVLRMQR